MTIRDSLGQEWQSYSVVAYSRTCRYAKGGSKLVVLTDTHINKFGAIQGWDITLPCRQNSAALKNEVRNGFIFDQENTAIWDEARTYSRDYGYSQMNGYDVIGQKISIGDVIVYSQMSGRSSSKLTLMSVDRDTGKSWCGIGIKCGKKSHISKSSSDRILKVNVADPDFFTTLADFKRL